MDENLLEAKDRDQSSPPDHSNGSEHSDAALLGSPSEEAERAYSLVDRLKQRNFQNILWLSFCFLLTFTAFQTTQFFAVKLLPGQLGAVSLAVLYFVFSISTLFAPIAVRALKPRKTMALGALGYALYIASLVYVISPLVVFGSCLIGIGAAFLWTAQGVYMTECSNTHNRGLMSGTFWCLYQFSGLPGNIISCFILSSGSGGDDGNGNSFPMVVGWLGTNSLFFLVLAAIGGAGAFSFLLLRKPDYSTGSKSDVQASPVKEQFLSLVKMIQNPRMAALLPLIFFLGINITFYAAWFTRQMDEKQIGLVMIVFSLGEAFGGFIASKVTDGIKNGKYKAIGFAVILQALALGMCWHAQVSSQEAWFFFPAPLLGIADSFFNTQLLAITSDNFTAQSTDAFALFRTIQALGSTVAFLITPLFGQSYVTSANFLKEIFINGGCLLFGVLMLLVFMHLNRSHKQHCTSSHPPSSHKL